MAAFAIFIRDRMKDPEEFKIYAAKAGAARGAHPIKALAYYGALDVLEGSEADGVVLVQFPDMVAARAWYDSSAYQEAKAHRLKAADYRVILVEGLANT